MKVCVVDYDAAHSELGRAWGGHAFECPFRREPMRFRPRSWVMSAFANLANLAMIIRTDMATVSSAKSGIMFS